jgi:hypothetical protein
MAGATTRALPYRADARELIGWAEARARGRTPAQMRAEGLSGKTLEGVTLTAALLGLAREGELTPLGQALALADPAEKRALLRRAMLDFPAYGELLQELRGRGQATVDAFWIEAWWATHGYGGSPSNRQEGVAVLGRLAEHLGLGRYIQGRRGHPTRVEWDLDALAPPEPALLAVPAAPLPPADGGAAPPLPEPVPMEPEQASPRPRGAEVNRVRIALEGGLSAEIEVPTRLSRGEKRRLMELVDLLVADE